MITNKVRKRNRKIDFDYSSDGYYFFTSVTKDRKYWFGEVKNNNMILNDFGKILENCWFDLPNHYCNCILDVMIIMPNHIHGIIQIDNAASVGTGLKPVPTDNIQHGLSEFIRALKTFSSRKINQISTEKFMWQRSFHDRIIRNEKEYINISNYINNNIFNWESDNLH